MCLMGNCNIVWLLVSYQSPFDKHPNIKLHTLVHTCNPVLTPPSRILALHSPPQTCMDKFKMITQVKIILYARKQIKYTLIMNCSSRVLSAVWMFVGISINFCKRFSVLFRHLQFSCKIIQIKHKNQFSR